MFSQVQWQGDASCIVCKISSCLFSVCFINCVLEAVSVALGFGGCEAVVPGDFLEFCICLRRRFEGLLRELEAVIFLIVVLPML